LCGARGHAPARPARAISPQAASERRDWNRDRDALASVRTRVSSGRVAGAGGPGVKAEAQTSVRALVRNRLALRGLLRGRLAVLRRRAVVARQRRRDDRGQAAADQQSDELRAHEALHFIPPADLSLSRAGRRASALPTDSLC